MSPNKTGEKIPSANGAVYKQEVDGTLKCVKWLKTKPLEQEIQTLLQLKHENLVQLLSVYQENDEPGLVYEWMEDGTLCQFLSNRSVPLTSDLQKTWALQVCRGLDYLHSQKLIHRDLKPENVLLTGDFLVAKIAFGLERQRSYEMDLYKAPELGQGKRNTVQSNVYALGLILYEIFASQTLDDRLEDDDVQLADPNLSRIIKQCLSVVRTQRPTIAEMLSVLAQLPGVYLTLKSDMEDSAYSSPVQPTTESVHEVCKSGNVQQMRELLRSANVNERDPDGSSPLFYAAEMGHLEMCRQLILRDADCNLQNNFGETPMHAAAANGRLDVILLLLENKAHPGLRNKMKKIPLDLTKHDDIRQAILSVTGPVEQLNDRLLEACEQGHLQRVRMLIQQGADPNTLHQNGYTPLNKAAENGHAEICSYLLKHGSDIASAFHGSTSLHLSAKHGHTRVCHILLEFGSDVNQKNVNGSTPLHESVAKDHLEVSQLLIESGADDNAKDKDGKTPLHLCSLLNNLRCCKLLVSKQAIINCKNDFGLTPLHLASLNGNLGICQFLVENGADLNARDSNGISPLQAGVISQHLPVCQFLLQKGADPNVKDGNGLSSLHWAAQDGHLQIVKLLLQSQSDPNQKGRSGKSPLHEASENGHLEVCKLLVSSGASLEARTSDGKSVSFVAKDKHPDVYRYLRRLRKKW